RAMRVAPHEGPGKDNAVLRIVARGSDAVGAELRHDLLSLLRRQHARREPAFVLYANAALEHSPACLGAHHEQVAALTKPDVVCARGRDAGRDPDPLRQERDVLLAGELCANTASVASARSAAEIGLVDNDDVADAVVPSEVVGDAEPHDSGADDDE